MSQKIDSAALAYSYNSWEVVKQYAKADLSTTGNTNSIDSVTDLVLSRLKGTNIYKISSKQIRLSSVTSGARGGVSFTTGLTLANSVSDNVGLTWNYNDNSATGCEMLQIDINASGVCQLSTYYNSNSTNLRYWQLKDFIFEVSA